MAFRKKDGDPCATVRTAPSAFAFFLVDFFAMFRMDAYGSMSFDGFIKVYIRDSRGPKENTHLPRMNTD